MTYKIIFLDFDGTLIPVTSKTFNIRNIDNLNELIRKTEAKIVVSSDWRDKGLEYVKNVLCDVGVKGDIIDITPTFKIQDDDTIKVPRGLEIKEWINRFNFFDGETLNCVMNYVILDDHFDMLIEQIDNFVHINPSKGFDGKSLKEALDILTKEKFIS